MNNTITEMKNTLEGINSRITEAEEWISDLEDRMVEFTATEQNKEKLLEENIGRTLCDINHSKIFFDPLPRVMEVKTKINNWDLMKHKSF